MLNSGNNHGSLSRGLTDVLLGFFRLVGLGLIAHSSHSATLAFVLTVGAFLIWLIRTVCFPEAYGETTLLHPTFQPYSPSSPIRNFSYLTKERSGWGPGGWGGWGGGGLGQLQFFYYVLFLM
jgi:hypothetical protein